MTVFFLSKDFVLTFNWFFENQPIALKILTQPSHYKRVESNLLADEKSPKQRDPDCCLVIHLYYKF